MKYPNPCCRCGFCCLSETCPVGMKVYGIKKFDKCPALKFEGRQATCVLSSASAEVSIIGLNLVPIGDGCCIKARAYRNGVEYDFASLPVELKQGIALAKRGRLNDLGGS